MTSIRKNDPELIRGVRWCARAVGLVATAFLFLFIFQTRPSALSALPWISPTGKPLFSVLMAVVGVLVAWRWETTGGVMALAASLAIVFLVYLRFGTARVFPAFTVAAPLLIAGAMFLGCTSFRLLSRQIPSPHHH